MPGVGARARLAALALTTALCTGLAAPALAESPHPNLDANGVDLTDGSYNLRLPVFSIGAGQAELPLVAYSGASAFGGASDNWTGIDIYQTVSGGVTTLRFDLGTTSDTFKSTDGFAASTRGTGATVTVSGNAATYTTLDGVSITFYNPNTVLPGFTSAFCSDTTTNGCYLLPSAIDGRSGMTVAYNWDVQPNCTTDEPDTGS